MADAPPYAPTVELKQVAPDTAAERPVPGTRLWFVAFLLWMGLCAAVALNAPALVPDPALAMPIWILALMCFYLALCNAFFPAPTAWIIMLAAIPDYALIDNTAGHVALVTVLATTSTVLANLNEYHVLAYMLQSRFGQRIRRAKVVDWALRWFNRAPFQLLTLVAFIPIPVDALRWLAVLRRYPRLRFALAYALGRGPRYALFATLVVLLDIEPRHVLLIQVVIVAVALLARLGWRYVARPAAPAPENA